jgi:hypothetical protein
MGFNIFPPSDTGISYVNISAKKDTVNTSTASVSLSAGSYKMNYKNRTSGTATFIVGDQSISMTSTGVSDVFNLSADTSSVEVRGNTNIAVWPITTPNPGSNSYYNQITDTGNEYFAVNSMSVRTSTNGESWSAAQTVSTTNALNVTAYSSAPTEKYVVAGNGGTIYSSTDLSTWTLRTSGTTSTIVAAAGSPTATEKFILGVGTDVRTSTNGITWTNRTNPLGGSTVSCALWGNGIYVLSGASAKISTSTDGITWTARTTAATGTVESVTYQNSNYFYRDGSGYGVSTDAITWTRYAKTWNSSGGGVIPVVVWLSPYYYTNGGAFEIHRTTSLADGWTFHGFQSITAGNLLSNGSKIVTTNGYFTTTGDLVLANNIDIILENTGTTIETS